jgi:hypothetical protein
MYKCTNKAEIAGLSMAMTMLNLLTPAMRTKYLLFRIINSVALLSDSDDGQSMSH